MKSAVGFDISSKWRGQWLSSRGDPVENRAFQTLRIIRSCAGSPPLNLKYVSLIETQGYQCKYLRVQQYVQRSHRSLPLGVPQALEPFPVDVGIHDVLVVLCYADESTIYRRVKIRRTHEKMIPPTGLLVLPCVTSHCSRGPGRCIGRERSAQNVGRGEQGGRSHS